jgi:hypothetical protein
MKHIKLFENFLINEADEADFKLTKLNPDAGKIKEEMSKRGLKLHISNGDGVILDQSGKNDKGVVIFQDINITLFNKNISMEIGISKDLEKNVIHDLAKYIETNFSNKYNITKGEGGSYWTLKMVKK